MSSPGCSLISRSTSAIAVCSASAASRSLNRLALPMAIAACSANALRMLASRSSNGRTSWRFTPNIPYSSPSTRRPSHDHAADVVRYLAPARPKSRACRRRGWHRRRPAAPRLCALTGTDEPTLSGCPGFARNVDASPSNRHTTPASAAHSRTARSIRPFITAVRSPGWALMRASTSLVAVCSFSDSPRSLKRRALATASDACSPKVASAVSSSSVNGRTSWRYMCSAPTMAPSWVSWHGGVAAHAARRSRPPRSRRCPSSPRRSRRCTRRRPARRRTGSHRPRPPAPWCRRRAPWPGRATPRSGWTPPSFRVIEPASPPQSSAALARMPWSTVGQVAGVGADQPQRLGRRREHRPHELRARRRCVALVGACGIVGSRRHPVLSDPDDRQRGGGEAGEIVRVRRRERRPGAQRGGGDHAAGERSSPAPAEVEQAGRGLAVGRCEGRDLPEQVARDGDVPRSERTHRGTRPRRCC